MDDNNGLITILIVFSVTLVAYVLVKTNRPEWLGKISKIPILMIAFCVVIFVVIIILGLVGFLK